MTNEISRIPDASYGVLIKDYPKSELDDIAEQVRRLGFAILDSGFSSEELLDISEAFNQTRAAYIVKWGEERLRVANEFHTIRAPLAHGDSVFLRLATNENLMAVLGKLIVGKFILNQQNGIINPPKEIYNQSLWHRDLPYQHYVSSSPLAVNALFCVDDFNLVNGSTFVLPSTHKTESFPSESYIKRNALQVQARAGQYILLDCMLFHSGGFNYSETERRAVNHVYTIPYFKQQINLPKILTHINLALNEKELFGFGFDEPDSIEKYLNNRVR